MTALVETRSLGRSFGGLRADHRIRPLGVEALLRVGREVGIAQPLGQALPVAARMGIDPLHGLPERGVTASLADALDQARVGGCRGLVHRERQVMPLPGDLGMLVDPAFEHGEVRTAERAFEVGVLDHRETRIHAAVAPRWPCGR